MSFLPHPTQLPISSPHAASNFLSKMRNPTITLVSALNFIVFLVFDFLDTFLCVVCRYIDELFEGQASSCYCTDKEEQQARRNGDGQEGEELSLSETLYERKNVFRKMGFLGFVKKWRKSKSENPGKVKNLKNRWSDCGCQSCVSWTNDAAQKLHFVIGEPETSSQGIFIFFFSYIFVTGNDFRTFFFLTTSILIFFLLV